MLLKALNSDLVNREFSAAPTVHPTVVRMHLNKRHIRDVAPGSKENKRCSHNTRILPLLVSLCLGTLQASFQDTISLTRARYLLLSSTHDGTSISLTYLEKNIFSYTEYHEFFFIPYTIDILLNFNL